MIITVILAITLGICLFYGRVDNIILFPACIIAGGFLAYVVRYHHHDLSDVDALAIKSKLRKVSKEYKIIFAIVMIISSTWSIYPVVGIIIAIIMIATTVFFGKTSFHDCINVASIPLSFIMIGAFAILVELSKNPIDDSILSYRFASMYISVTKATQIKTAIIIGRSLGAVASLIFLYLSTPMTEIIATLNKLRVPTVITNLMYLIYRYIFMLYDTYGKMWNAAKARLGYIDYKTSINTTGLLYSNLLGGSYRRASDNFDAMESRGYDGKISFFKSSQKNFPNSKLYRPENDKLEDIDREIIRLESISFRYEDGRQALKDISLVLKSKQRVVVLGDNGAGKSTLFLCCNGILKAQTGALYLNNKIMDRSKSMMTELRRTVGLVFQDADSQIIATDVESEISFGPVNLGLEDEEIQKRVITSALSMGLLEFKDRVTHDLSGGEKKRVTIADVLAMKSELILFDEPTAGLDGKNSKLLLEKLEELYDEGLGLVISTHDVDFAWRWSQRIILLKDGSIRADDTPENVFGNKQILDECGISLPTLYTLGKQLNMNPLPKRIEDIDLKKL